MADKQIINSCEFQSRCIQYKDMYSNKHIKCPIIDFALACRGENKCKYKTVYEQLKAKEQELEEFRGVIRKDICSHYVLGECSQNHHNNCVGRNQCIKDLEQECEELRKQWEFSVTHKIILEKDYKAELNQLKAENEELKGIRDRNFLHALEEQKRADKLSKTLTEIKEIANKFDYWNSNLSQASETLHEIIEKISEVEDEI